MDRTEQVATLSGAAADQWGLVTAAQAKALGVNGVQLLRLTEAGLLASVGRGVYLLAAAGMPHHLETKVAWLRLQPKQFLWERLINSPDSGVISHASACQLLELGDIPAPEVEISTPRRRTTTEPSVRLRTAHVEPTEITTVDGLPVTTALRTTTDLLRTGADGGHIGGVIADAERRDLIAIEELAQQVQPFARRYGLRSNATGHDLIDHLVAQAGERLRRQEVDQASQEGFDQAVSLLAEHPGLVDFMRAQRMSQPNPGISEALSESFNEVIRRMSQPNSGISEAIRRATQPNPGISEALSKSFSEAIRRATQPNSGISEAIRRATQPNPAISEAIRKMAQLNFGKTPSISLSPATLKALQQAVVSVPAAGRAALPPTAANKEANEASNSSPYQAEGVSDQEPGESVAKTD